MYKAPIQYVFFIVNHMEIKFLLTVIVVLERVGKWGRRLRLNDVRVTVALLRY